MTHKSSHIIIELMKAVKSVEDQLEKIKELLTELEAQED